METSTEKTVIEIKPLSQMARLTLIAVGTLALALAIIGIFLPGIPTTPFLLITIGCYSRSSDRLYHWVLTRPWLQVPLRSAFDFKAKRALPLSVKLFAQSIAWLSCVLTVFNTTTSIATQVFVFLLALSCTIAMSLIKTTPNSKPPREKALGFFQQLGYGALAGFIGGLVWGIAGRTIMRFVANVAEKAPQFNLRLTLMMIVATAIMGLVVGLFYIIIRKWIPTNTWVKGSLFGLIIAFTLGYALYLSPVMQADIARVGLEWRPLIVSLFIPNFIAYGLATALSYRRFTSLE